MDAVVWVVDSSSPETFLPSRQALHNCVSTMDQYSIDETKDDLAVYSLGIPIIIVAAKQVTNLSRRNQRPLFRSSLYNLEVLNERLMPIYTCTIVLPDRTAPQIIVNDRFENLMAVLWS